MNYCELSFVSSNAGGIKPRLHFSVFLLLCCEIILCWLSLDFLTVRMFVRLFKENCF